MLQHLLAAPFTSLLMFGAGVLGCAYVVVQSIAIAIAARWPTVEGEIVSAYLVRRDASAQGLEERVIYRYHVAGRPFIGDRVRFGPQPQRASVVPASGHPPESTAIGQQYPRGHQVQVRYNPRRPQESVLYAQPNFASVVIYVATAVTLYLGVRDIF